MKKINNMRSKLFLFIFLIIILTIIPLGIYSTNNLNNTLYQEKEKKIKEMVEIGLGVLERFHKLEKSGELTKEEAQNQALSAIKNMIFGPDDKDYFWINNYEPKMLMHPYSTRLMGESVGNIQDEKGKYLFRDMVEVVEEKGSGFVEYHWKYYDEENRVEPKLSYVSGFEPWNWILGTGVYINDVQDSYNNLCNRFIMMGIVILALSLILTYFISNYFAKPIIYLTNKFDKISNYDLTMKKNDTFDKYKNRSDEIGEMMKALSKMQANISDMINKIGAKAEELETKKEELKVSNEQLTAYNEEIKAMNEELEQSFDEVNNLNKRFVEMVELVANMEDKTLLNEKEFFAGLLENAIKIVPEADYGKICIIDENNQFDFIDAVGHKFELLNDFKIDKKLMKDLDKVEAYKSKFYCVDSNKLSKKQKEKLNKVLKPIKDSLNINIIFENKTVAKLTLDIKEGSNEEFSYTTQKILKSFASLAASFFGFKRFDSLKTNFTKELISSIVKILEMYDRYTSGHSESVADIASSIAQEMELSQREIKDTYWAGMVHDIGKLLVPLRILNKDEALTDSEYELIKEHPYWGYKALSKSDSLKHIAKYVLHHHERWDGKGYPYALKGDEIPLISQILAVADAWDAMTSKRAYREPLSEKEAIQEIIDNKGKQFSPQVAKVFLKMRNLDN